MNCCIIEKQSQYVCNSSISSSKWKIDYKIPTLHTKSELNKKKNFK